MSGMAVGGIPHTTFGVAMVFVSTRDMWLP